MKIDIVYENCPDKLLAESEDKTITLELHNYDYYVYWHHNNQKYLIVMYNYGEENPIELFYKCLPKYKMLTDEIIKNPEKYEFFNNNDTPT